MAGKGSTPRPHDSKVYRDNHDRIFTVKLPPSPPLEQKDEQKSKRHAEREDS